MLPLLDGIKNIDVYEIGILYNYGSFSVSPIRLYHDVLNCGYRIFKDDHKTIHCTDTSHLEGIEAKGYDLYAIEFNYDEDTIFESVKSKKDKGEFAYKEGAINSHLSIQQANQFIFENMKETSKILMLHKSENV